MINISVMICHFSGMTRKRQSYGKQRLKSLEVTMKDSQ